MSDDLVAFISARLAEDEAAANAVDQEPQRPVIGDTEPRPVRWHSLREWFSPIDGYPAPYEDKKRTALAGRFDPARVLREVEAARADIALYLELAAEYDRTRHGADMMRRDALRTVLQHRAAAWDGHADYRQEWAA